MILTLDLSSKSTGYCLFSETGEISSYGIIKPLSYPGRADERYPKRSVKNAMDLARQIKLFIQDKDISKIVIEEVNIKASIGSMIGSKSLCGLHFIILSYILNDIDKVQFMTSSEWRKLVGLKKNGDWKLSAIELVNKHYGTSFKYADNDIVDAIAMGLAYFKSIGIESKKKKARKVKAGIL